jgi:outer membrane scaffolding protein for murein synthesis (MipA/OmpV family)
MRSKLSAKDTNTYLSRGRGLLHGFVHLSLTIAVRIKDYYPENSYRIPTMNTIRTFSLASLLVLSSLPALADYPYDTSPVPQRPAFEEQKDAAGDWDVSIGAGLLVKPEFLGSEDYEIIPLPVIDARWRENLSINTRDGISYDILKGEEYKAGIGAGYDFGRDEDDGDDNWLDGTGDIDPAIETRLYAEYGWEPVWLEGEVRADTFSSGHEGWLANVGVKYRRLSGKTLYVSMGPSLTWASEDYMDSYFGIDAAQAAQSRFGAYDTDSGLRDYSFEFLAVYSFNERWSASGFGEVTRLTGDAADSPITQEEAQFSTGAAVSYRF